MVKRVGRVYQGFLKTGPYHRKRLMSNQVRNIIALVLAAGKGTRMKSRVPKVLHEILGKTIIG